MSAPQLLAPPKLTVRAFTTSTLGLFLTVCIFGALFAAFGFISVSALLFRLLLISLLLAAALFVYPRLSTAAAQATPERSVKFQAAIGLIWMTCFQGPFLVLLGGTRFGAAMSSAWWIFPFMFGGLLAAAGVARRVGDSMHCPQCEYEFKFDNPDDAPIRCPECGTGWLGRLKKGRRLRSNRLIIGGVAFALFVAIVLNPVFYLGRLAPHLPTPLLFTVLYLSPKSAHTAWDELATRPLAAPWTRIMAQRVLSQRRTDQYNTSPTHWLETMNTSGKIPADLVERLYSEGFKADLFTPQTVKAGQPFTVSMRITQASSGWGTQLALMFGGYSTDQHPTPIGRQSASLWAHDLRPRVFSSHRDVLTHTFTAQTRGPFRVKAVYWIAYQPSFMEGLSWQPDGTPATPTMAMWFQRFEIEKSIRVE